MSNNLERYLVRIGYRGELRPTHAVLTALLRAQVSSVLFENLDVQLGTRLTTDVDAAYDKIVRRRRGGWCYEQNGVFGWALARIGFDVTRIAASVMRHERGEESHANHLCLLVCCDDAPGPWLADVGFGGSLWAPIEVVERSYTHRPFTVGLRNTGSGEWRFWEDLGNGEFSYDFLPVEADETAMARRSDYLQTEPTSSFVLNLVAQLRRPDSHLSLRGRVLRIASASGVELHRLESAAELLATLRTRFALDVPEVAQLWPRILARHADIFSCEAT